MNPRIPLGRTLTLFCDAKGEPQPKISWFINDTQISLKNLNGLNITFGENQRFIQVLNVSLKDRAIYRCEAKNQAGKDDLFFKVDILRLFLFLK